ncbi:MAG TPA: C25 family cysteine peptidase [Candidatus Thermoplasmatota archaeon]|nr:C25 family cysteine peptidase [Candidatus Thermoplasmatota archaeon]
MKVQKAIKRSITGKEGIAVILCILMVMTAFTTATNASVKQELRTPTQATVDHLSYTYAFQEPTIISTSVCNSLYSKIDMAGCIGLGKQAGNPTMPVKFIQLLLPPLTTVDSITVTGNPVQLQLKGIDLTTQPIFPYQNEIPLNSPLPQEIEINKETYASTSLYPSETYGDYHIGYSHGYAIMDFSLNPVQYIPKAGQLFYYPELAVKINLRYTGYENQFFANNPEDEVYVKSLVSNPEIASLYNGLPTFHYASGGLCDSRDHYDYVIVTSTRNGLDHWDIGGSLTYNWDSLIAEHAAQGLTSTEVLIEDINANPTYWNDSYYPLFNDTPAHLREFCKDAYQNWGTRYVLIAGDNGPLPARLMDSGGEYGVDADIYFSNLDKNFNANHNSHWGEENDLGFDPYAELYVGRVVCEKPQDVSNWLTKSFFYADSADSDYLDNAAFYGGDMGWDCQGDDFVDFSAVKTTTNWLGPHPGDHGAYPDWLGMQYGFETWNLTNPGNMFDLSCKWSATSPNPGWQGGTESGAIAGLRDAINNDQVTLLSVMAHANPHYSADVLDTDWSSKYHNTQPFFIFDMGCHCGDFDDSNGVLDVMLFNSDTSLAFACMYNTGYGWGGFEDTNTSSCLHMKCFWDYFFDVTNNSLSLSEWQFGKGQAFAKDEMAPTLNWTYSSAPGSWRETIQCCLFFGDPAQMLKTPHPSDAPEQPNKPVGKTMVCWNRIYNYTSSATDPNGDQIYYLFDWGDGTNSGWLGPYNSGQTVTASQIWTILGNFSVTVRARDVWGAGSMPSDSLQVWVRDDSEPSAPTIQGPTQIKPHVSYTFILNATSEFGHDLLYDIDWGDGHGSSGLGPYHSGEAVNFTHTWTKKGTYVIKARATDTLGMVSDWSTMQVVAPLSATYQGTFDAFLQHLFERFPHLFPILRHLIGY